MLELLLLIVYILSLRLIAGLVVPRLLRPLDTGMQPPGESDQRAQEPGSPEPEPAGHNGSRTWIDDTEHQNLRSFQFVGAFGIDHRFVRDVRAYRRGGSLATLPPRLAALLRDLHPRGAVRGAEAMGLLFHGRPLTGGEALYFAVVDPAPERIVAFIDRQRDR